MYSVASASGSSTTSSSGACAARYWRMISGVIEILLTSPGPRPRSRSYRLALRPSRVKRRSCALQVLTEPSCSLDPCPRGPGGLPHRARRECPRVPPATHHRHPPPELSHSPRTPPPDSPPEIIS